MRRRSGKIRWLELIRCSASMAWTQVKRPAATRSFLKIQWHTLRNTSNRWLVWRIGGVQRRLRSQRRGSQAQDKSQFLFKKVIYKACTWPVSIKERFNRRRYKTHILSITTWKWCSEMSPCSLTATFRRRWKVVGMIGKTYNHRKTCLIQLRKISKI